MALDALLARARAAAEGIMEDTCSIVRDPSFAGDSTLNTATGVLTGGATVNVYSGPCRVRPAERQDAETEEGGAPMVRSRYVATLPLAAAEAVKGDLFTLTVAAYDPQLVGTQFTVEKSSVATHAFQRVLDLKRAVRADAQ